MPSPAWYDADTDDADRYPNGTLRDLGDRLRDFAFDEATPDHHSQAMGQAFRELERLRELVARVEALVKPCSVRDAISGHVTVIQVAFVKGRELRAALAGPAPVAPARHDDTEGA